MNLVLYHQGMTLDGLKTRVKRLPKNFKSNRFWILWGGRIYLRSNPAHTSAIASGDTSAGLTHPSLKLYLTPSRRFLRSGISPDEIGVVVTELGKFGNMVRRLANSLKFVKFHEIADLIIPRDVVFHEEVFRKALYEFGMGQRIWFGALCPRRENPIRAIVAGDFYGDIVAQESSSTQLANRAWRDVRKMLDSNIPVENAADTALTIHVRSGDVFGNRKALAYGQPPLAYYLLVIEKDAPDVVNLVFEDNLNPVVEEIRNFCRSRAIKVNVQSGTIGEDLHVLLQAKTLVAGRGTFIPGIAGLSRVLRRIYYFENKCNVVPRRSELEMIRVYDKQGVYREKVLQNNWENTDEQRILMLTYPRSSLGIESSDSIRPLE